MTGPTGRQPAPDIFTALGLPTAPPREVPAAADFARPLPSRSSSDAYAAPSLPSTSDDDRVLAGLADMLEPHGSSAARADGVTRAGGAARAGDHDFDAVAPRVELPRSVPPPPPPRPVALRGGAMRGAGSAPLMAGGERTLGLPPPAELPRLPDLPSFPAPTATSPDPVPFHHDGSDAFEPGVPPDAGLDDDVVTSRAGGPWVWVAVSGMFASALAYVLYSQTDLFQGDVIARRDAEATARAVAEYEAKQAEVEQQANAYGTVQLDTTPEGARVWLVQSGPAATFPELPVAHEYAVAVLAPGHVPQVRVVQGSELGTPVAIDLEPAPDPQAELEIPDHPAPRLGEAGDQTATLQVTTNTPGASLALLVGYTPGARMVDLDIDRTHRFRVDKPGHRARDLVLKGRHWEETPEGELVYVEHLELEPLPEGDEAIVVDSADVGGGALAAAPGDVDEAESEPPPAPKKKRRKKKQRRKKKRR